MQTLKTAIVVLLLMTVMYGSYVSLTTPPEPLPDAVASLIEESGNFGVEIDAGLPESLANLGDNAGQLEASLEPSEELTLPDFAMSPSESTVNPVPPQVAGLNAPPMPAPRNGEAAVSQSISDRSSTPLLAADSSPTSSSKEQLQLPKPSPLTTTPKIDPARDYPTTGPQDLPLPDPQSIAALPATSSSPSWTREAKPVSFELPSKDGPITAQLTDTANTKPAFVMPGSTPDLTLPAASPAQPNLGLANAIQTADRQYAADQHLDALATLSLFYNTPDLSPADRTALLSRLDPLAASVIYSRQHLLEQPHRVAANETLMEIATRYELPWQLLANINGIDDPVAVLPGTELKVVRGPFRAEVDLQRSELTIFVRDLYAGRFPITVGTEPAPEAGTYTIQDKQTARTFYDKNGSPVPPGDARNPYGSAWMDLGKQLCIHGSPDRRVATNQGCISLSGDDSEDLLGILSQGSSVTIRR